METKFTKGPWNSVQLGFGYYKIKNNDSLPNEAICILHHTQADGEKLQANARLIAAAPELLEALSELFEHCSMIHSKWGENCNQKEADAAIAKGKAAIKKAIEG